MSGIQGRVSASWTAAPWPASNSQAAATPRASSATEPQGAGPTAQGGHGPHDQRPGQGQEHHEGENREGGCHGGVGHVGYLSSQNLLARTATRTRSVPTSM